MATTSLKSEVRKIVYFRPALLAAEIHNELVAAKLPGARDIKQSSIMAWKSEFLSAVKLLREMGELPAKPLGTTKPVPKTEAKPAGKGRSKKSGDASAELPAAEAPKRTRGKGKAKGIDDALAAAQAHLEGTPENPEPASELAPEESPVAE